MDRYLRQLLEAICDKLEIDYSAMKQEAIEANKAQIAEREERIAKRDRRIAGMEAVKLPSQILREQQEAEAKRLQNLSADELADLRAAYISADQAVSVAWDAYIDARCDESISPIERDRLHDEWNQLAHKAHEMRQNLKIAQGAA